MNFFTNLTALVEFILLSMIGVFFFVNNASKITVTKKFLLFLYLFLISSIIVGITFIICNYVFGSPNVSFEKNCILLIVNLMLLFNNKYREFLKSSFITGK